MELDYISKKRRQHVSLSQLANVKSDVRMSDGTISQLQNSHENRAAAYHFPLSKPLVRLTWSFPIFPSTEGEAVPNGLLRIDQVVILVVGEGSPGPRGELPRP